jgi:hypothetical protein
MAESLTCWKCGETLKGVPLPLSRLAECPNCRAYLHACRLCEFHDPGLTGKCREERAEAVLDRETANFCDWFRPRPNAHRPAVRAKAEAAKSQLDGLFGDAKASAATAPGDAAARADLDRLFRHSDKSS